MNRAVVGIALVIALTTMPGCSVKPWIHVFNNSEERIIVRVGQDEFVAEPDTKVSFLLRNDDLAVEIGKSAVHYRVSAVPPEYIRTGWFRGHITFQVEADQTVFVLSAQDHPPVVTVSYPQPAGYPLIAISNDAPRG